MDPTVIAAGSAGGTAIVTMSSTRTITVPAGCFTAHTHAHTVQLAEGKCKLEIKMNGVQQLATSLTAATGTHMPPGKGNTPALATYNNNRLTAFDPGQPG